MTQRPHTSGVIFHWRNTEVDPKAPHVVQVSSLLKKPSPKKPHEAEEFLTKLRSELTNTLDRGQCIQIK